MPKFFIIIWGKCDVISVFRTMSRSRQHAFLETLWSYLFKKSTKPFLTGVGNRSKFLKKHLLDYYTQHSKTGNVYIFVITNVQIFTSQIFGVIGPLGENFDFFSPLKFDVQTNSDHKTQKNQALLSQIFKNAI